MMTTEKLLARAQAGNLSKEDLANAINRLKDLQMSVSEQSDVLRAASIVGAAQYTPEIESLLYKGDEIVSHLALHILFHWHTDGRYNDYILNHINLPVGEDEYAGLQHTAISLAGEWLRTNDEPNLLRALLLLFHDGDADPDTRGVAYDAIVRAMGVYWRDLPFRFREFDPLKDVDEALVIQAKERVENKL